MVASLDKNGVLKTMSDKLDEIKEKDPKRYERVIYARKIMTLLLIPTVPVVFWLNFQTCKTFFNGCNFQGFISIFSMSLFVAMYLLMIKVINPLLLRKFGKEEMLQADKRVKEAIEEYKKETASEEYKKSWERTRYLARLSATFFALFVVVFFSLFWFFYKEFGFPRLGEALMLAAILGYAASVLVTEKIKNKSGD